MRSTVCAASVVCNVPKQRCPVSAAVMAREIVSAVEDRLALHQHAPETAPQICAELLVKAEALEASYGPEPSPGSLLALLPLDVRQIAIKKRALSTVAA